MVFTPPFLSVALILFIVRVSQPLLALPGSFARSLALGLAAILLIGITFAEGESATTALAAEGLHGSGLLTITADKKNEQDGLTTLN